LENFDKATLSRFDIYYSRENNKLDKEYLQKIFLKLFIKIKQTNKNVTLGKNKRGLILKIGNRKRVTIILVFIKEKSLKNLNIYEMKGRSLEKKSPITY
jgi:hypothetical protein